MSVNRKLCRGCRTYENNVCLVHPSTIRNSIKKMCPCIECLIKGMCNSECKDYMLYEEFIKSMLRYITKLN